MEKEKLYEAFENYHCISKVPVIDQLPEPLEFHKKYVYRSMPVVVKNGWNQLIAQEGISDPLTHTTLHNYNHVFCLSF